MGQLEIWMSYISWNFYLEVFFTEYYKTHYKFKNNK